MRKKFSLSFIALSLVLFSCKPKQEHETLSADNIVINYNVEGSGKTVLVFVHGWCCDQSYWKYQVAHFSKDFKVVTIDLAGHGKSGIGRRTWSMGAFGKDVLAVLEKINFEHVILIGHSMGGAVIIETAKQIPTRVIGLVGVDTYRNIEFTRSKERIENILGPFKNNFKEATNNFVRGMFTPDADSAFVKKIADYMSSAPPDIGIGALQEYFSYDHVSALKDLEIPIVCINSDKWPTNVEAGQRHAISFELKPMPGIGHFVMMEDPDKFNKLLTETVNGFSQ
jgi:pimeloyl-ACP methyl ester carboxylesterase